MPGHTKLTALGKVIAAAGGDEVVWSMIRSGLTMREIGKRLGKKIGGASPDLVYAWIHKGGDERRAAFRQARKASSDAVADRAGDRLDELAENSEKNPLMLSTASVKLAEARASHDRWLAGAIDSETYGEKKAPMFAVGELHLNALRAHGGVRALPEPIDVPALPVEVSE